MQDTAKYLIHANIVADSVVERSDVVGAIFGQTEGLLGEELDLRDLQDSSKVGRIDVQIESEAGQSFGEVTIATNLDKVETAILGAALETIDRVGPCRSTIEVDRIEDVRAARRREVVDRAKSLLTEAFEGAILSSDELVEEVRRAIRVEDVTEYAGYPAGPRVADSDAIIVVEGRADVITLLQYGIKNAIAVEGTDVPDEIADLTGERTVTAFLDGDHGGEVVLKELGQVGELDYVGFAPPDRSVEDLSRHEVMAALRDKVPYETVADASEPHEAIAVTDGSSRTITPQQDDATDSIDSTAKPSQPAQPASTETDTAHEADTKPDGDTGRREDAAGDQAVAQDADATGSGMGPPDGTSSVSTKSGEGTGTGTGTGTEIGTGTEPESEPDTDVDTDVDTDTDTDVDPDTGSQADSVEEPASEPETLGGHVEEVIEGGSGDVRLLDGEFRSLTHGPADDVFEIIKDAEQVPTAVVLDGELSQRILDVAAQRGVDQVVAGSEGEFVKRPASVRVRTADQLLA